MTDDYKIKMSFSAEDYRKEYLEMKGFLPSEAKKVEDAIMAEFLEEYQKKYQKEILATKGITGEDIGRGFSLSLLAGGFGSSVGAIGGAAAGLVAAPAAAPFLIGGIATMCLAAIIAHSADSSDDKQDQQAKAQLLDDLVKSDLLKKYIDGRKRYRKPLPNGFAVFEDHSMAERYAPIIEAQASVISSVPLIGGPFNEGAEKKPKDNKPSSYFPPPSPPFMGGMC